METSTQRLIGSDDQEKISYTLYINPEEGEIDPMQQQPQQQHQQTDQQQHHQQPQPLKKVENTRTNQCLYNDLYDDDEGRIRLRKRNPENWKQNVRKRNKNKGLEYVKANGEVCEKKKLGPPCSCKEKCYLKIGMEACQKIFRNFWLLGDHALQNAYIAGCVRIFLPKHCYKKDGVPSRRFFSRNFHVTVNGVDTEVCKQAFLNMHAISNGRLDRLLKKKQEIGNTGFDERGRHSNKVNKIPVEKIRLVRQHINGFRRRAGFTGKRKPKKVEILPGLLNIRTMYRSYREEMAMKGLEPVCEYRYRKIFHSDFHIDFGKTVVPTPIANESNSHQQPQPQQQQPQPAPQLRQEKQMKPCQRNNNIKKMENFANTTLQNMSVNVQVANAKPDKQMPVYAQLEPQSNKEFHMRPADATSYVLSQEVFRLDYSSTYNTTQQNWVFPNQN